MDALKQDKDAQPLPSLNALVFDYVSHQAYAGTARALAKQLAAPHSNGVSSSTNGTNGHPPAAGSKFAEMDIDSAALDDGDGLVDVSRFEADKHHPSVSGVLSEEDAVSIERRRAILNYILDGAIMRAVDALNTHFPSVLDDDNVPPGTLPPEPSSSSSSSALSVLSNSNGNGAGLPRRPSTRFKNTPVDATPADPLPSGYRYINHLKVIDDDEGAKESNGNDYKPPPPPHSVPKLQKSTHPSHVKLNLQIQQFIESFRNMAPTSPSSSPSSSISSMTSSMHMSTSIHAPHGGPSHNSGVTLTNALTAAQGLHAEAKKLPPDVRAVYLQEIKDVGALFAYTDPEKSILKGFLDQERRIALAEQVNAAILASQGSYNSSYLERIAARTTALYRILSENEVNVKPEGEAAGGEQLAAYWKYRTGIGYRFRLHDFVAQSWS